LLLVIIALVFCLFGVYEVYIGITLPPLIGGCLSYTNSQHTCVVQQDYTPVIFGIMALIAGVLVAIFGLRKRVVRSHDSLDIEDGSVMNP
jgi:uncharacterized membrane protein HdeD (DUF308 family)